MARKVKKIKKKLLNYYYKFINSLVFDYVGDFHEGFAKVKIFGKYNFINPQGELLWKGNEWFDEFDRVGDFSEGFAWVKIYNRGYNFINTKGELVYKGDKWFDLVWDFDNGFAEGILNDKIYKINTKGELIKN